LILGTILFIKTGEIQETVYRYDIECAAPATPTRGKDNSVCATTFEIDDTMKAPIYMYY